MKSIWITLAFYFGLLMPTLVTWSGTGVIRGLGMAEIAIAEEQSEQSLCSGKVSSFGGPKDLVMTPTEGLALVQSYDTLPQYFLSTQPEGTTGLARRLDRNKFYMACRWDYSQHPKSELVASFVKVKNPRTGWWFLAKPIDWGPSKEETDKSVDLSPGLMEALGLVSGDNVEVWPSAETKADIIAHSIWLFRGIAGQECRITEVEGGQLQIVTEKGVNQMGRIQDSTQIILDPPYASLTGTISSDGDLITWSNKERWVRKSAP